MPKKNMSPEERKAWGEKMKAARLAKAQAAAPVAPPSVGEEPPVEVSPEETVSQVDDVDELRKQVEELRQVLLSQGAQQHQTPVVTDRGIRGTRIKFSLDPKNYPTKEEIFEKLLQEAKLTIQGFGRDWWDINYEIGKVNYETKDGINTTEPKFRVELIRIIPDEEGMPSKKRYVIHKLTLFEDPDAAIQVANQMGIDVPDFLEKDFLDEMRYIRIRDWIAESFYKPRPTQPRTNMREQVVENRLVNVWEANSTEAMEIPFEQIKKF